MTLNLLESPSQIKDLVLKISGGGNRQCKGASSSSSYRSKSVRQRGHQPRYTDGSTSDGGQCKYVRSASSSSMPTWGFTTNSHNSDSETRQRRQWISGGIGFPPEDDDNYNDNDDDDDDDVVLQDNGEPKEWMAQVEPGVHITFVSLPGGAGNDLKRIRFRFLIFLQRKRKSQTIMTSNISFISLINCCYYCVVSF